MAEEPAGSEPAATPAPRARRKATTTAAAAAAVEPAAADAGAASEEPAAPATRGRRKATTTAAAAGAAEPAAADAGAASEEPAAPATRGRRKATAAADPAVAPTDAAPKPRGRKAAAATAPAAAADPAAADEAEPAPAPAAPKRGRRKATATAAAAEAPAPPAEPAAKAPKGKRAAAAEAAAAPPQEEGEDAFTLLQEDGEGLAPGDFFGPGEGICPRRRLHVPLWVRFLGCPGGVSEAGRLQATGVRARGRLVSGGRGSRKAQWGSQLHAPARKSLTRRRRGRRSAADADLAFEADFDQDFDPEKGGYIKRRPGRGDPTGAWWDAAGRGGAAGGPSGTCRGRDHRSWSLRGCGWTPRLGCCDLAPWLTCATATPWGAQTGTLFDPPPPQQNRLGFAQTLTSLTWTWISTTPWAAWTTWATWGTTTCWVGPGGGWGGGGGQGTHAWWVWGQGPMGWGGVGLGGSRGRMPGGSGGWRAGGGQGGCLALLPSQRCMWQLDHTPHITRHPPSPHHTTHLTSHHPPPTFTPPHHTSPCCRFWQPGDGCCPQLQPTCRGQGPRPERRRRRRGLGGRWPRPRAGAPAAAVERAAGWRQWRRRLAAHGAAGGRRQPGRSRRWGTCCVRGRRCRGGKVEGL